MPVPGKAWRDNYIQHFLQHFKQTEMSDTWMFHQDLYNTQNVVANFIFNFFGVSN